MVGLGYEHFGAQGGDIGAGVSMWLARSFPDAIRGIHLNFIPGGYRPPLDGGAPPVTSDERAYLDHVARWSAEEGPYAALHATKPQTLAFALTDSPVGLAAWIIEKFRSWTDGAVLEDVIPFDTLLTNISIYWFGGGLTAALRLYKENRLRPLSFGTGERVRPPAGVAVFPKEIAMPPRSWVERVFDVTRWTTMEAGGHFAALEQPEALAVEIRAFLRPLRHRIGPVEAADERRQAMPT